jgi:hypothetical protein
MVIHDAATFPGLVVTCRSLAFFRSNKKAKTNLSGTTVCLPCPAARTPSRLFGTFETFHDRCRKSWRNFLLPQTSFRTRSSRCLAGRGLRSRSRPSRTVQNLLRKMTRSHGRKIISGGALLLG